MKRKSAKKAAPARRGKTRTFPKVLERKKIPVPILPPVQSIAHQRALPFQRFKISIEEISGNTPIGDLIVAFPRTREVLIKKGLRMEAEHAGDIYLTLEAFSALTGLNVRSFLEELVEAAKVPPPETLAEHAIAPTA
jgi:hypothetical protein